MTASIHAQNYILGDVNRDGKVTVADVMMTVNIIMNGYSSFSVNPTTVNLPIGGTATVDIIGGYDEFEVISLDSEIADASLNGSIVTINAIAGGKITVKVKDILTKRIIEIPVTVEFDPLLLSSNELTLTAGEQSTLAITSGSGSYSAESSDDEVATAVIEGNSVIVTVICGGTATITVRDTKSGQTSTIELKAQFKPLTLSSSSLFLSIITVKSVEITSGSDYYSVESSDESVATAAIDGNSVVVIPISVGEAIITIKDIKSNETTTIEVTVSPDPISYLSCPDDHHPHLIDLGLPSGTKWACCNVDSDPTKQSPTNRGSLYAWGELEEKEDYQKVNYIYYDTITESFIDIGSDIAGTEYDVAHMRWGEIWQMPTFEQCEELSSNCTYKYTILNGVKGGYLTSKTNGACIFLPLTQEDGFGMYWSSTRNPKYNFVEGLCIYNYNTESGFFASGIWNGNAIRPVITVVH